MSFHGFMLYMPLKFVTFCIFSFFTFLDPLESKVWRKSRKFVENKQRAHILVELLEEILFHIESAKLSSKMTNI